MACPALPALPYDPGEHCDPLQAEAPAEKNRKGKYVDITSRVSVCHRSESVSHDPKSQPYNTSSSSKTRDWSSLAEFSSVGSRVQARQTARRDAGDEQDRLRRCKSPMDKPNKLTPLQ